MKFHQYSLDLAWTGNTGEGTRSIAGYARDHRISAPGKPPIHGSSDPSFRGDPARWNPEELLVASLAACHKLWYLGLCAGAGVVVERYGDQPTGVMVEEADGGGRFDSVTLRPHVLVSAASDIQAAFALHDQAHALRFIARSVNFPVRLEPVVTALPHG
ncbi:OsmC family protein [Sphingomonas dokdonensis]|uniref:OsmC-like protein n=1 Tax=Sphingomonas dokdonensis TaxID=344880 RepID=A0A245ZTW7_9SPHN|nr:OsmC family protein [Sphingomonas dokdonensis]OWK33188.1 OsmC-like protein [Sphingomonas dokdonensis]